MDSADRLDFAPPPQPAAVRAFLLAILAHVLLLLALTWGINWNRDSQNLAAEAELWSGVPQQPEPKVEPSVVQAPPLPAPPPQPVPKVEPPPAPPVSKEPDIALEQEKKRQELAERKLEDERQKKLEAARKKREELELEKKQEAARKQQEEQKRQAAVAEQKALEEKKKKEEQAKAAKEKARAQAEAKQAQANREANLARMRSLAGTGPADNSSNGAGGPSTSYAAKIAARIRPNIRHPQDVPGNPPVTIEVTTSPDGTIVNQRVVKSSGNSAWDESAIRAIIATGSLPRDIDGRVHSPILVSVRQRD
jgi:colicin import membrane protein